MVKSKITAIDLHDQDTVHALEYLLTLAREGSVTGMVFALSTRDKKHPYLCGVSGRLASNHIESCSIAAMLSLKLTQESLEAVLGRR